MQARLEMKTSGWGPETWPPPLPLPGALSQGQRSVNIAGEGSGSLGGGRLRLGP